MREGLAFAASVIPLAEEDARTGVAAIAVGACLLGVLAPVATAAGASLSKRCVIRSFPG